MAHSPESLLVSENPRTEALRNNFCDIFDDDKKAEAEKLFEKITKEYQAETREYHNLEHIEKMLDFLQAYDKEIKDPISLRLATFFHDIVYDTRAKDNEEQSAQYAHKHLSQLDIPEDVKSHTLALIRATAKHEVIENNNDSAIFLDADLAILGSIKEEYEKYTAKIRAEYSWIPNNQFRIGRKKILQNFLSRPRIYFTERANKELEQQARINIAREIASLS